MALTVMQIVTVNIASFSANKCIFRKRNELKTPEGAIDAESMYATMTTIHS